MNTEDNNPESGKPAKVPREFRAAFAKSVEAAFEAVFRSTATSALAMQNFFDARPEDSARLNKYIDLINSEFPLDFGYILAKYLERIEESEKSGSTELTAKLKAYFDNAVKKGDELLAAKGETPDLLRAFDDLEDSLACALIDIQNTVEPEPTRAAIPSESFPKKPERQKFRLTDDQKQHIRLSLASSMKSWHSDVEDGGEGKYLILSPFRNDNHKGSFVIYRDGRAYDFATQEKFDTIDIWAKVKGYSKGDALYALAQHYGFIPIPKETIAKKQVPNTPPDVFSLPADSFFHHKDHGAPSVVYRYCSVDGKVIGFNARYETPHLDRKKQFCPFSLVRNPKGRLAWTRSIAGWNGVAPIYGIEKLNENIRSPIAIVEGEKTVAAASVLFPDHIVLTWQGGSGNVAKVDWSQLSGRVVEFIWPDADQKLDKKNGEPLPLHQQPGMKAAFHIASALGSIGSHPKIIMPPEGVADGWDLADALEEHWSPEKAQAHVVSNARTAESFFQGMDAADPKDKAESEENWRPNDIVADLRIKFAREVEQGSFEATFPFAVGFRNYTPSTSGATRLAQSILVSASDKGQINIARVEAFVDRFVHWYDSTGRIDYGEANLSDDQLRTLGNRLAQRLPSIGSDPIIFKKTDDPGHAWHLLDLKSVDYEEFKAIPGSRREAEKFSMDFLASKCPYWHEQLSRMSNRLAFLCYVGSFVDLKAKPQQYLWLHGDGQDGKSTILKVLKKVFGGAALMTDWPSQPNNFYTARFEGKRVLLIDEEPEGNCVRTDLWRRITGSETLTIEPKGKQAYEIANNLLIVVGSNYRPSVRARKADLRRLIICDVKTFEGIPYARLDEHLLDEFSDFISLCQALWLKFKGISDLAPVDEEVTRKNIEEVHAKISEFITENFEVMNIDRIKKAMNCQEYPNNSIPHTPCRELEKACRYGNVDYESVRQYLTGFMGAIPGQVSYSKMDKPRVIFGIVAKRGLRQKIGLDERSFELWPTFSPDMAES